MTAVRSPSPLRLALGWAPIFIGIVQWANSVPQPRSNQTCFPKLFFGFVLATSLTALALNAAEESGATFDAANKLYEQGRYPEAAGAYESLRKIVPRSPALYFNLGNAWFKSGQLGQAIAAWRQGEQLSPRDPGLRFNLQFARQKVSGSDAPARPAWSRAVQSLTLNEWAVVAATAMWSWFLLLALRELRPGFRRSLSGYTATAGTVTLLLAGCLAAASYQLKSAAAVVVMPEAVARSGPLEEAKVLHQFRDGVELAVLDEKEFVLNGQSQRWLLVRDGANRMGWLRSDQVALLQATRR